MAIFVQPNKEEQIVELMQKGVELRNALYHMANNPAEPKNRSLVRKHYAALRRNMNESFAALFADLSAACQ
jgi:type II secretory pathway component PulF